MHEKEKNEIIELIANGELSREEILEQYDLDPATLDSLESSPECQQYKQMYLEETTKSLIENLAQLTNKLIESIQKTAEKIPPKESLDMLLKLLEKAEKLGIPLLNTGDEHNNDISLLEDEELKEVLTRHLMNKDDK